MSGRSRRSRLSSIPPERSGGSRLTSALIKQQDKAVYENLYLVVAAAWKARSGRVGAFGGSGAAGPRRVRGYKMWGDGPSTLTAFCRDGWCDRRGETEGKSARLQRRQLDSDGVGLAAAASVSFIGLLQDLHVITGGGVIPVSGGQFRSPLWPQKIEIPLALLRCPSFVWVL